MIIQMLVFNSPIFCQFSVVPLPRSMLPNQSLHCRFVSLVQSVDNPCYCVTYTVSWPGTQWKHAWTPWENRKLERSAEDIGGARGKYSRYQWSSGSQPIHQLSSTSKLWSTITYYVVSITGWTVVVVGLYK